MSVTTTDLLRRQHWIFDMDGTLTRAVHDFAAIRAELGLPADVPILEALAAMPEHQATPLWQRLDEIELELARQATPMSGVSEFLQALVERGCVLGIVTRNSLLCARETLRACNFQRFFPEAHIKDRDCGEPKPKPDAVLELMAQWRAQRHDVVMVGDFLFDLQAGNAAGVVTVYVDYDESDQWSSHADVSVNRLDHLLTA